MGSDQKSEWNKMISGQLYHPRDPMLVEGRRRARDLLFDFNRTRDSESEVRKRILWELFGSVGEGVEIEPPFYCDYGTNISIGERVFFNFDCVILDPGPVYIGDNVLFGPAVQIYTATHPLDPDERRGGLEGARPVHIGSDVWVGGGVVICPGVSIGDGSVIGAGSVVTKDVPPGVVAAGNPCRVVRELM